MKFLRRVISRAGVDPKETFAAVCVILLTYALAITFILTWGPSP